MSPPLTNAGVGAAPRLAPALLGEYIRGGLIFMILPGGFLGASKLLTLQQPLAAGWLVAA